MNTNAKRNMARLIQQLKRDPIAQIVRDVLVENKSDDDGPKVNADVDASIRNDLVKAGFLIVDEKLKFLHNIEIKVAIKSEDESVAPQSVVVAMGISNSPGDALAQALYGYFKEQEAT